MAVYTIENAEFELEQQNDIVVFKGDILKDGAPWQSVTKSFPLKKYTAVELAKAVRDYVAILVQHDAYTADIFTEAVTTIEAGSFTYG